MDKGEQADLRESTAEAVEGSIPLAADYTHLWVFAPQMTIHGGTGRHLGPT